MIRKPLKLLAGWLFAAVVSVACAQPLELRELNRNGQLEWQDLSAPFVRASSYSIEWAARLNSTQTVWNTFITIPATNSAYQVDVPQFFRLRANVEAHFPKLRIGVFSDPHYMAPSLLVKDGTAFQAELLLARKLLAQSHAIMEQVTLEMVQANPQIVLVPGDLSKDGELISHQEVAGYLRQIQAAGARVFVCPGNHDINNPHALSYDGATISPVPKISPADFASIYADFGFRDALARDPTSLSYVAEPVPGLWILSLDSCRYDPVSNSVAPYAGGAFDPARLAWITSQLAAARSQGKFVIAMMHHGLIEHFAGEKSIFPGYVLDSYRQVGQLFADFGVKLVFTGHFHSQDVVQANFDSGSLFDIKTGSTITSPCPYRMLDLETNGNLRIASRLITNIAENVGEVGFPAYAASVIQSSLLVVARNMVLSPPYRLPLADAGLYAPAMAEAFFSHYQGDEGSRPVSASTQQTIATLRAKGDLISSMVADAMTSMLTDLPPADNDLTISLVTGTVLR